MIFNSDPRWWRECDPSAPPIYKGQFSGMWHPKGNTPDDTVNIRIAQIKRMRRRTRRMYEAQSGGWHYHDEVCHADH